MAGCPIVEYSTIRGEKRRRGYETNNRLIQAIDGIFKQKTDISSVRFLFLCQTSGICPHMLYEATSSSSYLEG